MAEPTPGQHPSPSPAAAPKSKQYIRASADDEALEPDALRGSENIIKELGIENEDDARREKITGKKE